VILQDRADSQPKPVRGAAAVTDQSQPSRPSPQLIYARVREDAEDQLARTHRALAFSGLFAGFTMGASYLALAIVLVLVTGPSEKLVAALLYPVGYVAVILGRAQLFTENTLYPVVPCLEERRHIPKTARLWAIVVAGNSSGGGLRPTDDEDAGARSRHRE
jgi:formate/nitrite transporter FocA (FNT family)